MKKTIKTYQELEDIIGTENFSGLKETFKDLNCDHNLNVLLDIVDSNSEINVYEYPNKSSVYIKTPQGISVVIQMTKP
jgi:spore coat polysaccharide biosynthesis protein SpsF (cytidylyltransferase family)